MRPETAATAFGNEESASPAYLRFGSVATTVRAEVTEAGYPGYASELVDAMRKRAAAEFDATAALPFDGEHYHSDKAALDRADQLGGALDQHNAMLATAVAEADAKRRTLASQPRPFRWQQWAGLVIGSLTFLALLAVGNALLLGPSIDTFLFRSYVNSVIDADAEVLSGALAYATAALSFFGVLGLQFLAVLVGRGATGRLVKLGFICTDLLFSLAFAFLRLGDHFSWQAVSLSLIEFALTLAGTVFLFALAPVFARNAAVAAPYGLAEAEAVLAVALAKRAQAEVETAEARFLVQARAIALREDGVRRAPLNRALAEASADAAYAVAASALIAQYARTAAEEQLTGQVDSHLEHEFTQELHGGQRR